MMKKPLAVHLHGRHLGFNRRRPFISPLHFASNQVGQEQLPLLWLLVISLASIALRADMIRHLVSTTAAGIRSGIMERYTAKKDNVFFCFAIGDRLRSGFKITRKHPSFFFLLVCRNVTPSSLSVCVCGGVKVFFRLRVSSFSPFHSAGLLSADSFKFSINPRNSQSKTVVSDVNSHFSVRQNGRPE